MRAEETPDGVVTLLDGQPIPRLPIRRSGERIADIGLDAHFAVFFPRSPLYMNKQIGRWEKVRGVAHIQVN